MKITNIRIENDEMIAFYEFANGSPCTQRFPFPTEMSVVKKWGEDKKAWFDQREIDVAKTEEEMSILREKAVMEEVIRARIEEELSAQIIKQK